MRDLLRPAPPRLQETALLNVAIGKRIERRLRRVVSENLATINRRRGVGVQRQRTYDAGHTHKALRTNVVTLPAKNGPIEWPRDCVAGTRAMGSAIGFESFI